MKKIRSAFFCQECGHSSPKWLGKCPSCNAWNTFVEAEVREAPAGGGREMPFDGVPQPLSDIEGEDGERLSTGMAEMDRVLGGGLVAGSAVLVGGDPGIGKSTLLLQVLEKIVVNQPDSLHLVILTREDPSLPLARLRANNRMDLVRADGQWWIAWNKGTIWPELGAGYAFGGGIPPSGWAMVPNPWPYRCMTARGVPSCSVSTE